MEPAGHFYGNFNGEPPNDLISIAPNMLAIVDHVSGTVVFTHADGTERGRRQLPGQFRVDNVRAFSITSCWWM
jgi:hypothetical protein